MASSRRKAAGRTAVLAVILLAGACSDEVSYRRVEIAGVWAPPDGSTVVLTVEDGGGCDEQKAEIALVERSESVTVSVRIPQREQPACPAVLIYYQLPVELKAPLGKRELRLESGKAVDPLDSPPGPRYGSIPVTVTHA